MTTATDMLASYLAAEAALLEGKEVQFNGRTLKYENLPEIRAGRKEWEIKVSAENAVSSKARRLGGFVISHADLS